MNKIQMKAGPLIVPAFFLLACLTPSHGSAGQSADATGADELDEIVVVAHKAERSVREIAANVTVLSRDELDNMLAVSAADVFRYSPGIDHVSSGSRFGAEGISISFVSEDDAFNLPLIEEYIGTKVACQQPNL